MAEAERALTFAKSAEVTASKELSVKTSALESAERGGENAKKALASAEGKLEVATKKIQEAQVKAAESKYCIF